MALGVLTAFARDPSDVDADTPRAGSPVPDVVRRRLAPRAMPYSWSARIAIGVVVAIAGWLRWLGLSHPKGKIFDEIYYATEGQELFDHGVEWRAENNAGDFVVHPPLGKWLIGLGEWLFGRSYQGDGFMDWLHAHLTGQTTGWLEHGEFGWRVSAMIAGTASVLIIVHLARRLFGSTVLGCAAGLLMALDGMHFVLSRAALLDVFLMVFILGAFACLVMDRDQRRARWLAALERGLDPADRGASSRPKLGIPWWRLGAAVLIGCACSVKWSGLWFLILLVFLIYFWEVTTRRSAGARHPFRDTFLDETGWVVAFGALVVAVYLASWSGWFATDAGWARHWLRDHGESEPPIVGALYNLWQYHVEAYTFHVGLSQQHPYQSWPWQWLLLGRPVAFYWSGDGPCGAAQCASEVLLLGTPVLWWSFIPALPALAWFGIARRDWRALAIGLAVATAILPWFKYELDNRTMFYFYALPAEPFLILAVVYVLGAIIGPAPGPGARSADRRLIGTIAAGVYVLAVAACFAYFYPIYTGQVIAHADWWARMWLGSRWI